MLRNSTEKYKQVYRAASCKKIESKRVERLSSAFSEVSLQMNSYRGVERPKSIPKVESCKKMMVQTQPIISLNKQRSKESDRQYTLYTSNQTELQTIQTVMKKKKGIEDKEIELLKQGKLKKTSKNRVMARDSQDFIENLPKNSLFFCCQCFQYVFQIQKRRHFPDCKDMVHLSSPKIIQIGLQKLKKLVQLSTYTQTSVEQVSELYRKFKKGEHKRLVELHYPKFSFYTLKEIIFAFAYIYNTLLREVTLESESSIFTCF